MTTTVLLGLLITMDLALLGAIFLVMRRGQVSHTDLMEELSEERRLLADTQRSVQEDLDVLRERNRDLLDRLTHIATEAEQEVKTGREALAIEVEKLVGQLSSKFDGPLDELNRRQAGLENLIHQLDQRKTVIQKVVARGEQICRFFDKRVPYEDVLREIEDKKYSDARSLLAQGLSASKVAHELGMNEAEVKLVADVGAR